MTVTDDGSDEKNNAKLNSDDTQPDSTDKKPDKTGTSEEEQAAASREAAKAGESRKKMAEALLRRAKVDTDARKELNELLKDDYERNYFEKKFGEDLPGVLDKQAADSPDPILKERVETLYRDREKDRARLLKEVRGSLSLSQEEGDTFNDIVKAFEGKEIGGRAISFEDALEMAAHQLRPGSPKGSSFRSSTDKRPEDEKETVKINLSQERINRNKRYTGASSAEDFESLASQVGEKGHYTLGL